MWKTRSVVQFSLQWQPCFTRSRFPLRSTTSCSARFDRWDGWVDTLNEMPTIGLNGSVSTVNNHNSMDHLDLSTRRDWGEVSYCSTQEGHFKGLVLFTEIYDDNRNGSDKMYGDFITTRLSNTVWKTAKSRRLSRLYSYISDHFPRQQTPRRYVAQHN